MTTEQLFNQRKKAYPSQDYATIGFKGFLREFKKAKDQSLKVDIARLD